MEETARDAVAEAARRRPGHPALIAGNTVVTWAELDSRVSTAAHWTAARTAPGDRVALLLGNTVDFVTAYFGVLRAGRVAVPLNPAYTTDERDHAITDSGASLVVDRPPGSDPAGPARPAPKPGDLAVLLYTSGTSGRPRGAMLTHAALAANHDQLDRIEPPVVGPDDVVLLAVPFFHAYGLNTGLGSVVRHAATGVLAERFEPEATLDLIAGHGVTVTIGVPGMYQAWTALPSAGEALGGVRTAVCGAAPLDPGVATRFRELTGRAILIGYGLTETAPVLTTTAVSDRDKTGSIGRPLPGVELLLRTAAGAELWRDGTASAGNERAGNEGAGNERAGNEGAGERVGAELVDDEPAVAESAGTDPGEIVVRGANLFSGYWPDGRDGPGPDGWWPTGDIAYADGDGDLVLVDRIGELILVNGFNVYPAEIERVLMAHPRVTDVAVVGVPDRMTGQRPYAYVTVSGDPAPTVTELQVHCAARLARFKLPDVELVNELPRNVVGKVRKRDL